MSSFSRFNLIFIHFLYSISLKIRIRDIFSRQQHHSITESVVSALARLLFARKKLSYPLSLYTCCCAFCDACILNSVLPLLITFTLQCSRFLNIAFNRWPHLILRIFGNYNCFYSIARARVGQSIKDPCQTVARKLVKIISGCRRIQYDRWNSYNMR